MKKIERLLAIIMCLGILLSACGKGPLSTADAASWQEQYDLGVRYLEEGNYEEAIIAFTAAIEIDPKRAEAYVGLADVYIAQGDYEKAQSLLREGMDHTEDNAGLQERLELAMLLGIDNLVEDAYAFVGPTSDGTVEYHIPKINLGGENIDTLNQEIYSKLFDETIAEELEYVQNENSVIVDKVDYQWSLNRDILSLVICEYDVWDGRNYHIYNISVLSGREITKNALLGSAGLSELEYDKRLEQALGSFFWRNWDRNSESFQDGDFVQWFNDALANTISEENKQKAKPFINSSGELCVTAPIYSMAGADYYYHEINLDHFELIPDYAQPATEPEVQTPFQAIRISEDDAYQIACDYWGYKEGDISPETGFEMFVTSDGQVTGANGRTYYNYLLRWLVNTDVGMEHLSTCDMIWIDAETGICTPDMP